MTVYPKFYDSEIVDKIRLNAAVMEQLRDNHPFSELEMVLGFSAYIYWLVKTLDDSRDKKPEISPDDLSYAAREVALGFVSMLAKNKVLLDAIWALMPFDPKRELEWGLEKQSPPEWRFCLTRSIILITRQLAYQTLQFTDSIGSDDSQETLDFLQFVEISDLFQEAVLWGSFILGTQASQELFAI